MSAGQVARERLLSVRLALSARATLVAVLALGLALRLALTPFGAFKGDEAVLRRWAEQLITQPRARFYAGQFPPDHLPGDMWVLWVLARGYHAFSGALPAHGPAFIYLLKLVPCFADTGIGLVLFLIARELADERVGVMATACWMLNPGPIFLASIWGQWDALSTLAALLALWAVVARRPGWALPALAYAALIKPTCGALLPFVLLAGWLPRDRPRASWRSLALGALAAYALLLALCLPMGVGVPPFVGHSSLRARLAWSWDRNGHHVTYNAFNLWLLIWARGHVLDGERGWLGWSLETWGALLTAAAYGAILLIYARRRDQSALLWACLATTLTLFMLPTRMHERYHFPAVALATLAAALTPRLRWAAAALALTYAVNQYWVYGEYYHAPQTSWMYSTHAIGYGAAALNLMVFGWLLTMGLRGSP